MAVGVYRLARDWQEELAVALAAWCAVMVSAALVAVVLGLQPWLVQRADGSSLFFPFGLAVVLPAILLPHVLVGLGEAVLAVLVWRLARARHWRWST
ncbi:energy-coupling factor ABC transporter permease [Pseudorhodoferax sp. Leaf267]|uniref:energy-coupling factor ABC transporter permease n=1 Tax=Pseudorhodoferax sp. Leaf267 TaxID=1736316 RepID=UPI001F24C5F2|nr:energy-coupling factor ABC transporter permease [Pseudorhodoferax sp. Leaf267]